MKIVRLPSPGPVISGPATWGALALFGLFAISLIAYLFSGWNSRPPSYGALLDSAVKNLEDTARYDLKIEEVAGLHSVTFQGTFKQALARGDRKIKGSLNNKELEFLNTGEDFLVRFNEKEKWDKAESLELDKLAYFVQPPLEIINASFHGDTFKDKKIKKGPEKSINQDLCHSYYWEISNPSFYRNTFPGLKKDAVEKGIISIYIRPEEKEIKKVNISIYMNKTDPPAENVLQRKILIQ